MKIIGIDPGTSRIGYGVIEVKGNNYQALDFGLCSTPPRIQALERLPLIYDFFNRLFKKHGPARIGLEQLFFNKNITTAMGVSEVRGVLILLAAQHGVPILQFSPPQVKRAISTYGGSDKSQVQRMVTLILGLKTVPQPDDVADALAIAICTANTIVE